MSAAGLLGPELVFSHWRGRSSIKSENIVTDFGSGGTIYEKNIGGAGAHLGVVVLF